MLLLSMLLLLLFDDAVGVDDAVAAVVATVSA